MNKLFTKVASICLGLAMAVGVGVAVASSTKEATPVHASAAWVAHTGAITAGNEYLIVAVSGSYSMNPANSTASGTTTTNAGGYSATSFTAASGPDRGFIFADAGSSKFYIKDGSCFVRANGTTNNGLASAASNNTNSSYGIWTVTETSTSGEYTIINDNSRQISLYQTTNWRSYGATSGNKTNVKLYEKSASYTISYNNNGGSGTMTSTTGSNPAVATCTFTAPTGKHFDHWNTSATDNGTTYAVGATPKATITLYAIWAYDGKNYSVTGTISHGYLNNTEDVPENTALATTLVPADHYHLPSSLTSVTMEDSNNVPQALDPDKGDYNYNNETGEISITSVTGDVVITASCIEDTKYSVTYTAGSNGSGNNRVTSEYAGTYELIAFNSTGLSADDGYRFKNYSVVMGEASAVNKNPGETITLNAATVITAIFEVEPTSISIAYTGSDTTNMDGTNEANSVFGLDASKWSVKANKNDPNNNIGLNANSPKTIRLYANKSNGNGNTLEVESLDEAVNITNVTFSFGSTCGNYEVKKVSGGTATTVTIAGGKFAINAPKFTIQNVQTGNTTQVHIESITVEFDYVDSFKAAKTFETTYVKRDIAYPEPDLPGIDGTDCLPTKDGGAGYFDTAVTEYGKLSSESKGWFASRSEFANARKRMTAWATANQKSFDFDTGIASVNSLIFRNSGIDSSAVTTIVIVVSVSSLIVVSGFFLMKRKEHR